MTPRAVALWIDSTDLFRGGESLTPYTEGEIQIPQCSTMFYQVPLKVDRGSLGVTEAGIPDWVHIKGA